MQQERWCRLDEIFHSALKLDPHRRAVFLHETCSSDADLRLEVERLLNHHTEAGSFLEEPAIYLAPPAGRPQANHQAAEGEMVLHYRVQSKIGSGGMGVVYQGEDLKLGRPVALKFLYDDGTPERQAIQRLHAEARAASSLNHPNICTIYAIEEHRGQPVLVMELLEGQNLHQRLQAGPLALDELIRIGMQICDALDAAHAKGIVHRDLKPANIFITHDGRLKLLDFGVAKRLRAPDSGEGRERIAGTLLYMSPEQLRGEDIDGRTDLFSLGVVLYELATGIRPFERSSALLTMDAVLRQPVLPPSTLNPALPSHLDRLIGQLLQKDRRQRCPSAMDLSRELTLLAGPAPQPRRKWMLTGIAAAVSVLCAGGLVYFRSHPTPVLTDKDVIVLGEFTNNTHDPAFSQTLRPALALALRQSPFLNLISDERIQHVFRLMAKPPDTPLTAQTAREVCERTQSAAVLNGSISGGGENYLLRLLAQNCRTGELLDSEQLAAARKEDVLSAVGQLAARFRNRAGEPLTTITQHSAWISEATTPSLEAWKSYTEGMQLGMLQGHAVAIPFLKRAIDIDPHFATALAMLGRNYSALGEMELSRDYTQHAFQQRDRASDHERFFIDYSYDRIVTGNLEKVLQTSELWTRAYPRDVLGHALYGAAAKVLGDFNKTVQENTTAHQLDADQPYPYVHLATVAVFRNNYPEAQRWLDRASQRRITVPDFLMIRHLIAFLQGNQAERERVDLAAEGMSEIQDWIWGERAAVFAFSGQLKQARAMSRHAVTVALHASRPEAAAQHEAAAAVREALFGNWVEARKRAAAAQRLSRGKDAQYGAALAFALAGDSIRAQALTRDLEQRYPHDTVVRFSFLPALQAIAAIQHRDPQQALALLRPAARYELGWLGCCSVGFVGSLYPIYIRGEAYLALGQGSQAAAEFRKIIDHSGIVGSNPIGVFAHWRKAQALAMSGQNDAAQTEYAHLSAIWREADPGLPRPSARESGVPALKKTGDLRPASTH